MSLEEFVAAVNAGVEVWVAVWVLDKHLATIQMDSDEIISMIVSVLHDHPLEVKLRGIIAEYETDSYGIRHEDACIWLGPWKVFPGFERPPLPDVN
jgi:hypothetical protein